MTRIEKIEQEIQALTREELSKLRSWFLAYDAESWDMRIEADAAAGKLDALGDAALADHRNGKTTDL